MFWRKVSQQIYNRWAHIGQACILQATVKYRLIQQRGATYRNGHLQEIGSSLGFLMKLTELEPTGSNEPKNAYGVERVGGEGQGLPLVVPLRVA